MFKFFDRDNNTLVLRPDITPAIARCVSKYFRNEDMPIRLCYLGDIFQNHKNYKGTLSESTQSGVELIGDDTVDADVEMIVLAIDCLLSAGLKEFQVEIGEVDFYRGLVEEAGLSPDEDEALRILIENRNSFGVDPPGISTDPITSMAQGEVACPTKAQPRRKTCGTGTRSMYRIAAARPARKAGFSARFSGSLPASR